MIATWPDADRLTVALEAWTLRAGAFAGGVGVVQAAGSHGDALHGTRVLVAPYVPCGECDVCRRGGASVCPTRVDLPADAHVTTHIRAALPLTSDLASPHLQGAGGALTTSAGALAYAMYARANIGPRDATIVVGDDVVAHLLIDVLIAKGAPPVVVSDAPALQAHARRRQLPHVGVADLATALAPACAAVEHGTRPRRIFVTGAARPLAPGALLGPRAAVTMLAPASWPTLDAATLAPWEATCTGVRDGHPDLLLDVAALVQRGELDVTTALAALDADRGWSLTAG